jgi:hypothetical protein
MVHSPDYNRGWDAVIQCSDYPGKLFLVSLPDVQRFVVRDRVKKRQAKICDIVRLGIFRGLLVLIQSIGNPEVHLVTLDFSSLL